MSSHEPFVGVRPPSWLGADAGDAAQELLDWTEGAEALDYDMVFVGDRLLAEAHGADDFAVYQAAMLDPFTLLSAMAARTQRVRLAPLVAVLPFRHPAYVAKITSTLDIISQGRLVLGVGSGWSDPELKMFDIDRRERGTMLEVAVELLRRLWMGESVSHDGPYWTLEQVRVLPRPVQRPGPPIWLGSFAPDDAVTWRGDFSGGQVRALERIGRIADGWVPLTYSAGHKCQVSPELLSAGWSIVRRAAEAASRNPDEIDVVYAHWIAVVRTEEERQAALRGLEAFFPGSYDEACDTYLIGTPDEILQKIADHTKQLDRVDGYLLTPIVQTTGQLEAIAEEVVPKLKGD